MTKIIFTLFIIINIFVSQLYAIEHLTEHGFEEHEHNGEPCELNIFYENYKFLDITNYSINICYVRSIFLQNSRE